MRLDSQIWKGKKYLSAVCQEDYISMTTSSAVFMSVVSGDENGSCDLQSRGVSCLSKVS